ncbi:hypothetical protein FRB91_001907 [Serendipita sp. 411]|nr:hypothetical protein FRB91_001907 [Serendipita sp. 411]
MTGMSSRQAGRAYVLEKSKGLSTLYSFHEQLIGVEDAFRNLIRGIPSPDTSRVPPLQAIISRIIGRHIAEETLRDKEELEEEGIDDCISHWYESMTVPSRKDAIVAHALQLVELKVPVFIPELWNGLLGITMQASLHRESLILLEYILLYYFTPYDSKKDPCSCPAASTTGRDITELYKKYTAQFQPADFLSVLLPILEKQPLAVWRFRSLCHFIRNLDADTILVSRIIQSMVISFTFSYLHPTETKTSQQDASWYLKYLCSRCFLLLCNVISRTFDLKVEELWEMSLLSSMVYSLWKWKRKHRSDEDATLIRISVIYDSILLSLVSKMTMETDKSEIMHRLARYDSMVSSQQLPDDLFNELLGVLSYAREQLRSQIDIDMGGPANGMPHEVQEQCTLFRKCRFLKLADSLERAWRELDSSGRFPLSWSADRFETSFPGSRKRKRVLGKNKGRKSKKLKRNVDDVLSEDTCEGGSDEDESDSVTDWSGSESEEESAGENGTEDEEEEDEDQFIYIDEKPPLIRKQHVTISMDGDNTEYEEDTVEEGSSTFGDSTFIPEGSMNGGGDSYLSDSSRKDEDEDGDDGELERKDIEEDEEEEEEEEDTITDDPSKMSRIANHTWGQYSAPVLRSVLAAKLHPSENSRTVAASRAARLIRPPVSNHSLYDRYGQYVTASSDDELDLLGRETRWSTP